MPASIRLTDAASAVPAVPLAPAFCLARAIAESPPGLLQALSGGSTTRHHADRGLGAQCHRAVVRLTGAVRRAWPAAGEIFSPAADRAGDPHPGPHAFGDPSAAVISGR